MDFTISVNKQTLEVIDKCSVYLAARDHSEFELKQKLLKRFDSELIDSALEELRKLGWLTDPQELSQRLALNLTQKNKSFLYIDMQLRKRGLPLLDKDSDSEYDKITQLIEQKFTFQQNLTFEDRQEAYKYLKYRGFDHSDIQKVLNEKS